MFAKIIREFTASPKFERLSKKTQPEYRRMLSAAEREFGDMSLAVLNDDEVQKCFLAWQERVAKTSGKREADNRLAAISSMMTWAVKHVPGVKFNRIKGYERLYHSNRVEIIWLPEHINRFIEVASIEMQRAVIRDLSTIRTMVAVDHPHPNRWTRMLRCTVGGRYGSKPDHTFSLCMSAPASSGQAAVGLSMRGVHL